MACGLPLLTRQKLPTHAEINVKLTKLDILFLEQKILMNMQLGVIRINMADFCRPDHIICIRTCLHTYIHNLCTVHVNSKAYTSAYVRIYMHRYVHISNTWCKTLARENIGKFGNHPSIRLSIPI